MNLDSIDNLALKGKVPNFITVKDPNRFKIRTDKDDTVKLSDNPQLDFVRKIANSVTEGSAEIQQALAKSTTEISYPKTNLGKNLEWIARLIKGNLNSKVYYTSQNGYDTHDNQLAIHQRNLEELDTAVFSFYSDLKTANLLQNVTLVVFSEFGRRVKDNGNGTDHGTASVPGIGLPFLSNCSISCWSGGALLMYSFGLYGFSQAGSESTILVSSALAKVLPGWVFRFFKMLAIERSS